MKLGVFIQKVLEETNADTVDFDVSVKLQDKELIVISDQKVGDMEVSGTRLKFTIIKEKKPITITYDYSNFPGGLFHCSSGWVTDQNTYNYLTEWK